MSLETSSSRAVKLVRRPSLSATAVEPAVEFLISRNGGGGGVDLGAVGRALGLDPSTVLLNGHYLSRGPNLVSAVTWATLLAFFSARGLPAGRDPIAVQGTPLSPAPAGLDCLSVSENGDCFSFKRKLTLEDDSSSKKNRVAEYNPVTADVRDRGASSHGSLCIKRTSEFEDSGPSKKQNTARWDSGTRDFRDREVSTDDSFATKRKLEVEDIKQFKRQNTARCNSGTIDYQIRQVGDSSHCIKRTLEFEDSSITLKKQNTSGCNSGIRDFGDQRVVYGDNFCRKRRPELEVSSSLKNPKIIECNPVVIPENESSCSCISGRRDVILLPTPSQDITNGEWKPVSFPVAYVGGVDLGAIGMALRLDPTTVRLNGHFLSRGMDLVSSVTWDSILSFFSGRGFPTGDSVCNPIMVQGKPLVTTVSHCHSSREHGSHGSFERKIVLEDENPCKNMIIKCDRIKRKPSLEDNHPCKKPKASASHLGLINGASIYPAAA